jgi:hypothetical protein
MNVARLRGGPTVTTLIDGCDEMHAGRRRRLVSTVLDEIPMSRSAAGAWQDLVSE